MLQKSAEIDALDLLKSQIFVAPNHGGGQLKRFSKSCLHVAFLLYFDACSLKFGKRPYCSNMANANCKLFKRSIQRFINYFFLC